MPRRVLLVQTAFLGDVILTTPMIRAFRAAHAADFLGVVVTPGAAALLAGNPDVNEVLVFDKKGRHRGPLGMARMIGEIRKREFDVLLSPHMSHRTGLLAACSGIPLRFGHRGAGFSRLAYHRRLERPMALPEIRRLLAFLSESIGCAKDPATDLILFETDASRQEAIDVHEKAGTAGKAVLLAPSSVWATKRWPAYRFAELAGLLLREYHSPVLLVGSREDAPVAAEVVRFARELLPADDAARVVNVCGQTSLMGLYSIMKRARLLVSNDSSPVHVGCAAGLPVVAIFGPTVPALGYAPIARRSIVAELSGTPCRPCGTHGARRCPLDHFRCMKYLDARAVMERVRKVMSA